MSEYSRKQHPPKITEKGTELPILDLKGKPYLQVAHRLVWFREIYPFGKIVTEFVQIDDKSAIAKATISIPDQNHWKELATAHKRETIENFSDHIEKAETGAVGRALAMCGFGTQFEPDFDEKERLADAPAEVASKPKASKPSLVNGTPSRQDMINGLNVYFKIAVDKKLATKDALLGYMREHYGVTASDQMTDVQIADAVTVFKDMVNKGVQVK